MIDKFANRRTGAWARIAKAMLVAVLLVSAMGIAPSQSSASAHVHATLLQAAAQKPDSTVNIIVQKTLKDQSVEQAVANLGGKVTKDLHIINAFAAQLPAKGITKLANTAGVRWISPDARMNKTANGIIASQSTIDATRIQSVYPRVIGADRVWNTAPSYVQGQNVAVAVIDTGVTPKRDLQNPTTGASRIVFAQNFISPDLTADDGYGHGTHIGGLIGSNGTLSSGAYVGVAPKVNLVNLRVGNDDGSANASDVVEAMQWINDNRTTYNVRVLNMSLSSTERESYMESPLDAACEILWFSGVVVVVSSGNLGADSMFYAPANDPFVISVGATDDRGTLSLTDDTIPGYSSYGTTQDGFAKPEIVAPGTNLISLLASPEETLVRGHENHLVELRGETYLRLSGTSMAAGVASGAAALLLNDEPLLNPDQVKFRLMTTAVRTNTSWPSYVQRIAGSGYLNAYTAVNGTSLQTANTGLRASQLLWSGDHPIDWQSVNWGSVNWGSVNWGSVNWGSVNWGSVNWGSVYWEP